jgi:dTDP-4-amino-4,6-dideoxygalactose transaminase
MGAPVSAPPTEIAFVDLGAQHAELRSEIDAVLAEIIDGSGFIGGPRVDAFEAAFADFIGTPRAVGVGHGTDAVKIALQLAGVGSGDLVLTVSHTFIGSVEGAIHLGAAPLFVDIDRASKTLSPSSLARVLEEECRQEGDHLRHAASGRRIAAILPVHLYGQPADMAPILEIGARYDVPVVEDAAQAHGARYRFPDGREAGCGAMGRTAAFSFYPGKNLGAMGEAGAVTTSDPALAARALMLRDHGQARKYHHQVADGGNSRLDAIQAAVLGLKLKRLPAWNERRRTVADLYRDRLAGLADEGLLELPAEQPWAHHVWHLFVVHSSRRDALAEALRVRGIPTGLHYPIPLHQQSAFAGREPGAGPLPETERAAATCLSLPMHPHLTDAQVQQVADAVRESVLEIGG